jgi:hypothetical protein
MERYVLVFILLLLLLALEVSATPGPFYRQRAIFNYVTVKNSPSLRRGEFIRMAGTVSSTRQPKRISAGFNVTWMFPSIVANRYSDANDSFVLVVHDVDRHTGFSLRTRNAFRRRLRPLRLISRPPSPLPPRPRPTRQMLNSRSGGYINGTFKLSTRPKTNLWRSLTRTGPSGVYAYVILENYVSNVVGYNSRTKRVYTYKDSYTASKRLAAPGFKIQTNKTSFSHKAGTTLILRGTCRINKRQFRGRKRDFALGLALTIIPVYPQVKPLTVFPKPSQIQVDTVRAAGRDYVVTFRCDPRKLLNFATAVQYTWYLHAACYQHVSNVIQIDVAP